MKICFFGTYDKKYSSNKIILDGFKKNFIKVLEINNDIRITPLNNSNHLAILNLIKRLWIKLSLIPLIFKNLSKIKKCDAIYVGYPGHIDILISYPLAKLLGKKLIFYPCIILYITFTEDVNLFTKDSIYAKLLKIYERFIYKLPDLIYTYSGVKNSKNLNVVYYGLYSPLHGVEHIINAAKILKNQKNVKFLMVGDGQTFDQNYKLAKKNKLKNVIFYKDATEDNAKEILNSGHLFLGHAQKSPTVFRTLPNKVYQGLALGKVVITADTPASRGVFNHLGNAYLFKPANPKDLAKGILLLSKNPKLVSKIAENGYKLYISRFTPKMIAKKIIDDVSILVSKQKIKGAIKYAAS